MPPRYDKAKEAELEACPGCRGEAMACGADPCKIRACAREREFTHCGLCAEFPCSVLSAFANDGVPHHSETLGNLRRLREVGEAAWFTEQRARRTCACGAKLSWYLRECPKCGRDFTGSRYRRAAAGRWFDSLDRTARPLALRREPSTC